MSKVGIAVATHNSEEFLEKCLKSILSQTFKDIQLFVCDDHSTDRTHEILEKYNVDCIVLQENSGSCAKPYNLAFNNLAQSCEYLYKVDSDDSINPDAVAKNLETIELFDVDWVCSYIKMFGKENRIHTILSGLGYESFKENNQLTAAGFFKAETWKQNIGFREDMAFEDWEFWVRLLKRGYKYAVLNEAVYNYRVHDNNETQKQGYRKDQSIRLLHKLHFN